MLGLGFAAGIISGILIGRRLAAPQPMPHLANLQRSLAERYGDRAAAALAARVQARYRALLAESPHPAHKALRWHLATNILPGLALYQVLREAHDQETALAEVDAAFASEGGHDWRMVLLARLPDPFPVLRLSARQTMSLYPPEGWDMETVEDSNQCYGFNMHRCFYRDTLTAYGAPELTALFCAIDDRLFAQLPPSILWERTKTIGRGDALCDFRYRRATA